MADIRPFRGIRYSPARIDDINKVITQPYDKISLAMKRSYLDAHPNSFVRLILPDEDESGTDRYANSSEVCNRWLNEGILVRDGMPGIYVYHQEFSVGALHRTRKGFIAVFRVDEFEKGTVLPHERTLSKAKADRLSLTRATRKDYEQIFMLYSDSEREIDRLLEPSGNPTITATDEYGVIHRLWVLTDESVIRSVQDRMADKVLLIADGHHRYETALAFRQEVESEDADIHADAAVRFKTAAFVNVADPGLVIFPTHRLLQNLDVDWNVVRSRLNQWFKVTAVHDNEAPGRLTAAAPGNAFVLHTGKDRSWLLELADRTGVDRAVGPDRSAEYKGLDVTVLHSVIIEGLLGVARDNIENHVKYEREAAKAMALVDAGEFQACFLMNSTRVEQVQTLSAQGERMPQKSTDFYPKLISGLVFFDTAQNQRV